MIVLKNIHDERQVDSFKWKLICKSIDELVFEFDNDSKSLVAFFFVFFIVLLFFIFFLHLGRLLLFFVFNLNATLKYIDDKRICTW